MDNEHQRSEVIRSYDSVLEPERLTTAMERIAGMVGAYGWAPSVKLFH